jgi:hypothetical protein
MLLAFQHLFRQAVKSFIQSFILFFLTVIYSVIPQCSQRKPNIFRKFYHGKTNLVIVTVLGNSGKPATLETSSLTKFTKWVFRVVDSEKIWSLEPAKPLKPRTCEDLESWIREALEIANLWSYGILNPRSPEVANLWRFGVLNPRSPEVANLWRSGILNPRSTEVANLWRHRVMNLWNYEIGNLWNSGIYWSSSSEVVAHEDFLNKRLMNQ